MAPVWHQSAVTTRPFFIFRLINVTMAPVWHQSAVTTRPFFFFGLGLTAPTGHIQDDVLPNCTVFILVSIKIKGQAPVETVSISNNLCKTKFQLDHQLSLSLYVCTY